MNTRLRDNLRHTYRAPLHFMEILTKAPYGQLFSLWTGIVIAYALAYFFLSYPESINGITGLTGMESVPRFWNSLYFSIVTSTTVGYGDLTPQGFCRAVAASQSVIGFFIAALFVAKIVSHRQEMTLELVYRLIFENVFYSTREGFYIIRKDFDNAIQHMNEEQALQDHDWENLTIAYRHAQGLLEDIPEFYQEHAHLYSVDEKRENLLLDAVTRTIMRLDSLLGVFQQTKINWHIKHTNAAELRGLLSSLQVAMPTWRKISPYATRPDKQKAFDRLDKFTVILEEKIQRAEKKKLPKTPDTE